LALSGALVNKPGGSPVKPYQPAGVWEDATFGNKKYVQDVGEKLYRRSLYTFWRRIIAPTMFFDTASRQVCTVKQPRTNTPLQALALLNDVTYIEGARVLAQRVLLSACADDRQRVSLAFQIALSRNPLAEEERVLLTGLDRLRAQFRRDSGAAEKYLAAGEMKRNDSLDSVEHAAYAALCLEILNLDEALTKE
jgi:hypothetical protein